MKATDPPKSLLRSCALHSKRRQRLVVFLLAASKPWSNFWRILPPSITSKNRSRGFRQGDSLRPAGGSGRLWFLETLHGSQPPLLHPPYPSALHNQPATP